MNIIFHHNFGHQELGEFFHYTCELINVSTEDHDEALESGFLCTYEHGDARWFQCRSTRLDVTNTSYEIMANAKLLQIPYPVVEMDHIYTSYCYYKKFKKYFEVGVYLPQDHIMAYYDDGNFVAWSKLRQYSQKSIETCQFVWDYVTPKLKLGFRSLEHEIAWAKESGYSYVYLGPGYERSSVYKAKIDGFEWWTGSEWSRDVEHYTWLCNRDSKIKAVSDLYGV